MEKLSLSRARSIILQNQLLKDAPAAKSSAGLAAIIEHLGYVQIDTISVVERAHNHILWTRFPAYKKKMLDDLLAVEKKIFEYWGHAAAYLPMKDFKYSHFRKEKHRKKYKQWSRENKKLLRFVYDRIKNEGPPGSRSFEHAETKRTGWWEWKPAKDALEYLFHSGDLMVAKREGFQKVYDLAERVLPSDADTSIPAIDEYHKFIVLSSVKANGLISEKEITYLRHFEKGSFKKSIDELLESGELTRVVVSGIENEKYLTSEKILSSKDQSKVNNKVHLLSPFDNLIIQRKRLKTFFDFEYTIECYVPAAKRKFGYYCMPVLAGNKFIGMVDAKADRAAKVFNVINYFSAGKEKISGSVSEKLRKKISEYAVFTGCEKVSWNGKI